jgi:hypothetical protein
MPRGCREVVTVPVGVEFGKKVLVVGEIGHHVPGKGCKLKSGVSDYIGRLLDNA